MKSRPKYWRSLAELEGDPEFHEFAAREFRSPTEQEPLDSKGRRRFMQLMGASFALAGCSYKEQTLLPHTKQPDGLVPGIPQHYATTMELSGVATSLLVRSYDGRPIKVEGNPDDSVTGGGTGVFHQAAILGLYDPDRSSKVRRGSEVSDYDAFSKALAAALKESNGGSGFAILSGASTSPTLNRLRERLIERAPAAQWVAYEATDTSGPRQGSRLAFGKELRPVFAPEKADVLVSLNSDLLAASQPGGLGYSRSVASRRDPDSGTMSRIYAFESTVSELGSLADHRVTVRPSQVLAIAAYIDAVVSKAKQVEGAQPAPAVEAIGGAEAQKVLDVAISDLIARPGRSLVTVGSRHAPEVHALVMRINRALGNEGETVNYVEPHAALVGGADELAALVADMASEKVSSLLILGANPVYDAPVDVGFAAALAKVKTSFHVGLYVDETAVLSTWHAPLAHFLESWGDARAIDGSVRLTQPLIEPLTGGKSEIEVLSILLGEPSTDGQKLVRATHGLDKTGSDKAWKKAVHDGMILPKNAPKNGKDDAKKPVVSAAVPGAEDAKKEDEPELQSIAPIALGAAEGGLEVIFDADPALHDGRFANNGWLQELPHPLSKLTWGNAALVSPATAEKFGLGDGHLCSVTLDGKSIQLPSLISPGQADDTVVLCLGYGRTEAGVVGGKKGTEEPSVGVNTYALRSAKAPHFAKGAAIQKTGGRVELPLVQDLWAIDPIGAGGRSDREDILVREVSVSDYEGFKKEAGGHEEGHAVHPGDVKGKVHHPKLLNLWSDPVSYDGYKWGMAIDLNKCTGCATCIVACQSENNTSVVGASEILRGREMTWIRVERYYKGDKNKAAIRQQPVMCQQCENAPCEQVCPVGATMHSPEGLNDMVYNRCIGTRYCSNNCPYKVRRFNYRNYNLEFYGLTPYTGTDDPRAKMAAMAFNPEVTVRSRGVMEKCTFCVQRIQNTKIYAKNEKRPVKDGEIKTACEQACPTGAIVFGDLNDKSSRVHGAQKVHRAYELLQELNNRPRVNYLARIQNPHPELSTNDGHSSDHH